MNLFRPVRLELRDLVYVPQGLEDFLRLGIDDFLRLVSFELLLKGVESFLEAHQAIFVEGIRVPEKLPLSTPRFVAA